MRFAHRPIGRDVGEHLYRPAMIPLPELLEAAWARALPGREAAERNEMLRLCFAALATCPIDQVQMTAGLGPARPTNPTIP